MHGLSNVEVEVKIYHAVDMAGVWQTMADQYGQRLAQNDAENYKIQLKRLALVQNLPKAEKLESFNIATILKDIKKSYCEEFLEELRQFCVEYERITRINGWFIYYVETRDLYLLTQSQSVDQRQKCLRNYKIALLKKQRFCEAKINELKACKVKIEKSVEKSFDDADRLIVLTKKEAIGRGVCLYELLDLQLTTEKEL